MKSNVDAVYESGYIVQVLRKPLVLSDRSKLFKSMTRVLKIGTVTFRIITLVIMAK